MLILLVKYPSKFLSPTCGFTKGEPATVLIKSGLILSKYALHHPIQKLMGKDTVFAVIIQKKIAMITWKKCFLWASIFQMRPLKLTKWNVYFGLLRLRFWELWTRSLPLPPSRLLLPGVEALGDGVQGHLLAGLLQQLHQPHDLPVFQQGVPARLHAAPAMWVPTKEEAPAPLLRPEVADSR